MTIDPTLREWLKIIQPVATLVLGILTIVFIIKQHKLNKSNFKLAAFTQRARIFDEINSFIAGVQSRHDTSFEECMRLLRDTRHGTFLFKGNKKILQAIDELYKKGTILHELKERLDSGLLPEDEHKKTLDDKHSIQDCTFLV